MLWARRGRLSMSISNEYAILFFFQTHLQATNINVDKFCIDRDIEIFAIKLIVFNKIFYTIAIYRSPAGKFSNFLIQLENALHFLYDPRIDFIVSGDMNIDFLEESNLM
jgi:hypothetical protein